MPYEWEYRQHHLWRRTGRGGGKYYAFWKDDRGRLQKRSLDTADAAAAKDRLVDFALHKNLLVLGEIFLLRVLKELDGVVAGRTAGAKLMPAIIDYARKALSSPERMRADVQLFYGWPNREGGWTWIEAIDQQPPKWAPDLDRAAVVVISASVLLHRFLREVLKADVEEPLAAVLRTVPAADARGAHVH